MLDLHTQVLRTCVASLPTVEMPSSSCVTTSVIERTFLTALTTGSGGTISLKCKGEQGTRNDTHNFAKKSVFCSRRCRARAGSTHRERQLCGAISIFSLLAFVKSDDVQPTCTTVRSRSLNDVTSLSFQAFSKIASSIYNS